MRASVIIFLLLICSFTARAAEEAELRSILTLFGAAKIGDDYPAIRKLAPTIGPLKVAAGDESAEALVETKIGSVILQGEFNFYKGRLISHGFRSQQLTHADAHSFLLRVIRILEELYGKSERWVELPNETDGPRDSLGIHFTWQKDRTRMGLDFGYRSKTATVSWGAQEEARKPDK